MWRRWYFCIMEIIKYIKLVKLSNTQFKRYTGVKKDIFHIMVLIVKSHEQKRKIKDGRTSNLSIEDQILITLEYY